MAKVRNPLFSQEASGRIGENLRYAKSRGVNRAVARRSTGAAGLLAQRRQAAIIGTAGQLWKTESGRGPEETYQKYVGGVSRESYFFAVGDVLLTWTVDTMMVSGQTLVQKGDGKLTEAEVVEQMKL